MRSKLLMVSGGTAAALWLLAGTAGAQGDRGDFKLDLGTLQPGAGATLRFDVDYRNPSDPNGKPPPIKNAVFRLPEGTRIDTAAIPRCAATDDELRARGTSACPPESRVGGGTLTAMTGFGPPTDPVQGDVTAFNGDGQIIEAVTAPGTDRVLGIDRLTIDGSTLTAHPPATPGGPPDGRTSVKEVRLTVDRAGYATAPPTCPDAGWTYGASYEFEAGDREENTGTLACTRTRSAKTRPALRIGARPRTARAGKRTRFRFAVRSSSAACTRGAKVRFAGRRAKTNSRGIATILARVRRPGRHAVNVSKRGCRTARGVVSVAR